MLIRRKYFRVVAALSLFSSIFGYASSSSSSSSNSSSETTQERISIKEMRKQCEAMKSDTQRKQESLIVSCYGGSIMKTRQGLEITKENQSKMTAQTSTKSGRYSTEESEYYKAFEPLKVSCAKVDLTEVNAPVGGVTAQVGSCAELTEENLSALCRSTIATFCADNTVAADSEEATDAAGMCVSKSVRTINTCDAYR